MTRSRAAAESAFAALLAERAKTGLPTIPRERWLEVVEAEVRKAYAKASPAAPKEAVARPRNALFDALGAVCGVDPTNLSRGMASALATALRDIREVSPELTVPLIEHGAKMHRRLFPGINVTPSSLAKWWNRCVGSGEPTRSGKLDPYIEPADWTFIAEQMHPGTDIAARLWSDIPLDVRGRIVAQIARISA